MKRKLDELEVEFAWVKNEKSNLENQLKELQDKILQVSSEDKEKEEEAEQKETENILHIQHSGEDPIVKLRNDLIKAN